MFASTIPFLALLLLHMLPLQTIPSIEWRPLTDTYDIVEIHNNGLCWFRVYVYRSMNITVCAPSYIGRKLCIDLVNFNGSITLPPQSTVIVEHGVHELYCTFSAKNISVIPNVFVGYPVFATMYYRDVENLSLLIVKGSIDGVSTAPVSGTGTIGFIIKGVDNGLYCDVYLEDLRSGNLVYWNKTVCYVFMAPSIDVSDRRLCIYVPYTTNVSYRIVLNTSKGLLYTDAILPFCTDLPKGVDISNVYLFGDNVVYQWRNGTVGSIPFKIAVQTTPPRQYVVLPRHVYTVVGRAFDLYTLSSRLAVNGSMLAENIFVDIGPCRFSFEEGVVHGVCDSPGRYYYVFSDGINRNVVVVSVEDPKNSLIMLGAVTSVLLFIVFVITHSVRMWWGETTLTEFVSDMITRAVFLALITSPLLWGPIYWYLLDLSDVLNRIEMMLTNAGNMMNMVILPLLGFTIFSSLLSALSLLRIASPLGIFITTIIGLVLAVSLAITTLLVPVAEFCAIYLLGMLSMLISIKLIIDMVLLGVPMWISVAGAILSLVPQTRLGVVLSGTGFAMCLGTAIGVGVSKIVVSVVQPPKIHNVLNVIQLLSNPPTTVLNTVKSVVLEIMCIVVPFVLGYVMAFVICNTLLTRFLQVRLRIIGV